MHKKYVQAWRSTVTYFSLFFLQTNHRSSTKIFSILRGGGGGGGRAARERPNQLIEGRGELHRVRKFLFRARSWPSIVLACGNIRHESTRYKSAAGDSGLKLTPTARGRESGRTRGETELFQVKVRSRLVSSKETGVTRRPSHSRTEHSRFPNIFTLLTPPDPPGYRKPFSTSPRRLTSLRCKRLITTDLLINLTIRYLFLPSKIVVE